MRINVAGEFINSVLRGIVLGSFLVRGYVGEALAKKLELDGNMLPTSPMQVFVPVVSSPIVSEDIDFVAKIKKRLPLPLVSKFTILDNAKTVKQVLPLPIFLKPTIPNDAESVARERKTLIIPALPGSSVSGGANFVISRKRVLPLPTLFGSIISEAADPSEFEEFPSEFEEFPSESEEFR
jgi:hypothetical protein